MHGDEPVFVRSTAWVTWLVPVCAPSAMCSPPGWQVAAAAPDADPAGALAAGLLAAGALVAGALAGGVLAAVLAGAEVLGAELLELPELQPATATTAVSEIPATPAFVIMRTTRPFVYIYAGNNVHHSLIAAP